MQLLMALLMMIRDGEADDPAWRDLIPREQVMSGIDDLRISSEAWVLFADPELRGSLVDMLRMSVVDNDGIRPISELFFMLVSPKRLCITLPSSLDHETWAAYPTDVLQHPGEREMDVTRLFGCLCNLMSYFNKSVNLPD